ncbi:MAG: VWA domain-containing protein [Planctomycetes bacterium]|nr:VWA domain-containing protein [Planctomycetota bacterium]
MPEAFSIRWKLDRPLVEQDKAEDVYALVTIEPTTGGPLLASQLALPAHVILLVDVSGSMDFLVRFDPDAKNMGEGVTEGQASQKVVSSVPSRREMACAVVQRLAERLTGQDLFTLVAFDDKAYNLATCLSPDDLDALHSAIKKLEKTGGGGTAMGRGLDAVRKILAATPDPNRTRKLVLLTDGQADDPGEALAAAQALGREFSVPIVALGTGECKVAFLKEVAQTTLAGTFNHVRAEADAEQLFHQVLAGQKNVQAVNVLLKLWLSPEIQVRELYRTRPEILFVGDVRPDSSNVVELRLEQMERGKGYEFLFRCTVPRKQANQRFRLAKATLTYDLPAHGRKAETVEANIVVEYTADAERARERSGDVRRALARAEVQRQILFIQAKADLLQQGQGSERDRVLVANVLHALVKKFDEFGDRPMANQFRHMEQELLAKGTISQDMLNRSLAASSRAEEVIVAQDIDF